MISLYKKIFSFFVALQMFTIPLFAEITTHVSYASSWTGSGLADEINKNLSEIQNEAYQQGKFVEITQICITPEWGYAYILYNLGNDEWGFINEYDMRVAYASAWTGNGIAEDMQKEIDSLQRSAKKRNKELEILDIRMAPEWGYAYIIYEIEK